MIYLYKYKVEKSQFKSMQGKKTSLGLFYLRQSLKKRFPHEEIEVFKDEKGKPRTNNPNVFVSVTHTSDIVICAISEAEIGIDSEALRQNLKAARIAERFFTESEKEQVQRIGDRAFYEIWCRKEAYSKLEGSGLVYGIKKISTVCPDNSEKSEDKDAFSETDEAGFYKKINGFPVIGEWIGEAYFACAGGNGDLVWIEVQE